MFRHPKYYTELRKRNKSDQAISKPDNLEVVDSVRPGPGQTSIKLVNACIDQEEPQAPSTKRQAPGFKHK